MPMLDRLAYIELLLGGCRTPKPTASKACGWPATLGLDAGRRRRRASRRSTPTAARTRTAGQGGLALEVAGRRQLRMIGAAGQWALGPAGARRRPAGGGPVRALDGGVGSRGTPRHPALGHSRPGGGRRPLGRPRRLRASGRPTGGVGGRQRASRSPAPPSPGAGDCSPPARTAWDTSSRRSAGSTTRTPDRSNGPGSSCCSARRCVAPASASEPGPPPQRHRDLRAARRRALGRPGTERAARIRRDAPPARPGRARAADPPGAPDRPVRRRRRQQRRHRRQAVPEPSHRRVPPRQGVHEGRRHLAAGTGEHDAGAACEPHPDW